jgi:hypothetical protein
MVEINNTEMEFKREIDESMSEDCKYFSKKDILYLELSFPLSPTKPLSTLEK